MHELLKGISYFGPITKEGAIWLCSSSDKYDWNKDDQHYDSTDEKDECAAKNLSEEITLDVVITNNDTIGKSITFLCRQYVNKHYLG